MLKAENLQLTGFVQDQGCLSTRSPSSRPPSGSRASSPRARATTVRRWRGLRAKAGIAATIFVPDRSADGQGRRSPWLRREVVLGGESFDDAAAAARRHVEATGATWSPLSTIPVSWRDRGRSGSSSPSSSGRAGNGRDPDRRRRTRGRHRDRIAGAASRALADRGPGCRMRAVRRHGPDRADDRGWDRRQVPGGAHVGDPSRPARRGRRRRGRGDLPGDRPAARTVEARGRRGGSGARGSAAGRARARGRACLRCARGRQHRRHHADVGDALRAHVIGPLPSFAS